MQASEVFVNIRDVSAQFALEREVRQRRRELAAADFEQLREAGFLLTGAPMEEGGIWESVQHSARPICDMLRVLAHATPRSHWSAPCIPPC